MQLLLASQSPRRRELMRLITPFFSVCSADVDETGISAPTPAALAGALAKAKAKEAASRHPSSAVIGCDTVVALDNIALGKPKSRDDALDMLRALAGRAHMVHTAVHIQTPKQSESFISTTRVWFAPIPEPALQAYVDTAEPYDKAGAYGIQGAAARYIPRIDGCYYNVMGLPVAELYARLNKLGLLAQ